MPAENVAEKEDSREISTVRQHGPYKTAIDFASLAARDSNFARFYRAKADAKPTDPHRWIDLQDPKALQQLSKSVLKADFGLNLHLRDDRLCPPIPVRWNYVEWVQRLIESTVIGSAADIHGDTRHKVTGLDIGVGASCIYSLLVCGTKPTWQMFGTDIDPESLETATRNVTSNHFEKRVKLLLVDDEDPIIPIDRLATRHLDFVMTNPPFYSSNSELKASYDFKSAPPSAVCTGNDNEMICPGGDVGFVTRIIEQSLVLKETVQWYTAMLGKYSSLVTIITLLKGHQIENYAVTSLQAGNKTKRWAIAWSFADCRPHISIARHDDIIPSLHPTSTQTIINVPLMSAQWAGDKVDTILRNLEIDWRWDAGACEGEMACCENAWSRAARRKRKFAASVTTSEMVPTRKRKFEQVDGERVEAAVQQTLAGPSRGQPTALAVQITCQDEKVLTDWVRGRDAILYQSFCGMLRRLLNEVPPARPQPSSIDKSAAG